VFVAKHFAKLVRQALLLDMGVRFHGQYPVFPGYSTILFCAPVKSGIRHRCSASFYLLSNGGINTMTMVASKFAPALSLLAGVVFAGNALATPCFTLDGTKVSVHQLFAKDNKPHVVDPGGYAIRQFHGFTRV
jgi:hypothetical protein